SNPEQVEIVRRYGNKVYFGDASKIELLRSAGTGKARFFVLAIDDVERSIATAKTVRHYFPGLPILARARDRHHAHLLMDLGITMIYRDTFQAGMELTRSLLQQLGTDDEEAERIVGAFEKHDTELLKRQHEVRQDEKDMIQTALQAAEELESLLQADRRRDDRS
ncbi:MAG: NAD-binding protein, partial [Gammaproteobacteria bacterium]|nr:NAD-binding protein [Gammaproteobacteria bacterium]